MNPKTPPGAAAFNLVLDQVLAVSRADFEQYEKQYRRAAVKNPRKPGPKRKRASRASGARD